MPKYRGTILAAGGITLPSGATFTNSGSTAFGANGTSIGQLLSGSVTITCASATASNTGSNAAIVANLPAGAKLFVTPGSMPQGFVLVSASATAASTITASFLNATTANISTSALVTLQYLAIS